MSGLEVLEPALQPRDVKELVTLPRAVRIRSRECLVEVSEFGTETVANSSASAAASVVFPLLSAPSRQTRTT